MWEHAALLKAPLPLIRAPAQHPRRLPALPSALVLVAFCISRARAMSPGDAPEDSRPAAGVTRGVGGMRWSGPKDAGGFPVDILSDTMTMRRDARGSPVDILSDIVTMCPGCGGPLGSLRKRVAEAPHGADQGRGVTVLQHGGTTGANALSLCARRGQGVWPVPTHGAHRCAWCPPLGRGTRAASRR
jgi:hypothetical protein